MIGETISHYRIVKKLGQGGMGEVYLAEDIRLNHQVAIKKLPRHLAADRELRIRFHREAKAVASLHHPYIVPLFEYDELDGELFLVTEYLPGGSLREVIRERQGGVPVENLLRWGIQAAEGLAEAHERGVLHRDIKPDNLLLTEKGDLRIADFGLAHLEAETRLTRAGSTIGTLAYLSPEQLEGRTATTSSDLFALGATLYELLTGIPAFRGESQAALLRSILDSQPTPIAELRPGLPSELISLIEELLQKEPGSRPSSARRTALRLRKIAQVQEYAETMPIPVVSSGISSKHVLRRVVALSIVLIVTAGLGIRFLRTPEIDTNQPTTTRVAVMPFTVRGADEYLGEGLVDLLSNKLDGAGSLRSVDEYVLLSTIRHTTDGQLDPMRAADIASGLGAQLYVLGDVFGAEEHIVVSAALYDSELKDSALVTTSVEGSIELILDLVDQLALRIVSDRLEASGDAPLGFTSINTESYDALKAFLEGERELRAGRPFHPEGRRAVDSFQSAVEADSTFALAWFRLATAAGWFGGAGMDHALRTALLHRDRLSRHDRLLLEAFNGWAMGLIACCAENEPSERASVLDVDKSERRYQEILSEWPDDFEAWLGLAKVRIYDNWRRGRSSVEARDALERALELDPESWIAKWMLAWVAFNERNYSEVAQLQNELYTDFEPSAQERAVPVFMLGSEADQAALLLELENGHYSQLIWASMNLALTTENLEDAERIARILTGSQRSDDIRALGNVLLAHLELARGRWSEARLSYASAVELEPAYALEYEALNAAMPFVAASESELQDIRSTLEAWNPTLLELSEDRSSFVRVHDHVHPILRTYLLGLLDVRLEDLTAAGRAADELLGMTNVPAVPNFGSPKDSIWVEDLSHGLRAQIAWASMDSVEALNQFASASFPAVHVQRVNLASSFYFESLERFLRAELFFEMGRYEEALGWYSSFGWCWGYEFIYQAPSNLRIGQIYDRMGEREKAIEHYGLFVQRWKDCDEHLRPVVDEARARMSALES